MSGHLDMIMCPISSIFSVCNVWPHGYDNVPYCSAALVNLPTYVSIA